jgi:hypothetical protein
MCTSFRTILRQGSSERQDVWIAEGSLRATRACKRFELMRKLIKVEKSNEETILAYMGRVTARTVCLDCGEEVSTFSRDQLPAGGATDASS